MLRQLSRRTAQSVAANVSVGWRVAQASRSMAALTLARCLSSSSWLQYRTAEKPENKRRRMPSPRQKQGNERGSPVRDDFSSGELPPPSVLLKQQKLKPAQIRILRKAQQRLKGNPQANVSATVNQALRAPESRDTYWVNQLSELLRTCPRDQLREEAERIFSEMRRHINPTTGCFNHLITAYSKTGSGKRAWKAFNDMKKLGLTPDEHTYGALYQAAARSESDVLARDVLRLHRNGLESDVIPRNRHTYNALMNALIQHKLYDECFEVYGDMSAEQGTAFEPDKATLTLLLKCCAQTGDLERARSVWRVATIMNCVDGLMLNRLIAVFQNAIKAATTVERETKLTDTQTVKDLTAQLVSIYRQAAEKNRSNERSHVLMLSLASNPTLDDTTRRDIAKVAMGFIERDLTQQPTPEDKHHKEEHSGRWRPGQKQGNDHSDPRQALASMCARTFGSSVDLDDFSAVMLHFQDVLKDVDAVHSLLLSMETLSRPDCSIRLIKDAFAQGCSPNPQLFILAAKHSLACLCRHQQNAPSTCKQLQHIMLWMNDLGVIPSAAEHLPPLAHMLFDERVRASKVGTVLMEAANKVLAERSLMVNSDIHDGCFDYHVSIKTSSPPKTLCKASVAAIPEDIVAKAVRLDSDQHKSIQNNSFWIGLYLVSGLSSDLASRRQKEWMTKKWLGLNKARIAIE